MMGAGDVGMRPKPALQVVLADLPEDRVQRIDRHAALLALQLVRKLDHRNRGVIAGAEEEGDGEAFGSAGGATTSWTSARTKPLVANSSSSPVLMTKVPGTGGAWSQTPSSVWTRRPGTVSCSSTVTKPPSLWAPTPWSVSATSRPG